MAKKPKFEKLQISCLKGGEMQFETAYDARDAAKRATRRAKAGWSCKVNTYSAKRTVTMMTCEPSQRISRHDYGPHRKVFARCTMTKAFKKRAAGR